jgi:hypothetical protein
MLAGSESVRLAVQAYAALGCQITRNIFSEVGYRYLYQDFRDGNFLYWPAAIGPTGNFGLRPPSAVS